MHPLLIPLALLCLGLTRKSAAAPSGGPKPTPPPGGNTEARAKLKQLVVAEVRKRAAAAGKPITAQPIRSDPYPAVTVDHPNVIPSEASQQAAVDAAVSHAIREDTAQPTAAPDTAKKDAAQKLLLFLVKTGRFGGGKDKPAEIKAAQKALGVKPDGIVGPKTRTAALNQGVALPPKP